MEIIAIITAFGAGSVLTALVQWFVSNRSEINKRKYDERKEAYIGLVESWVRQEKEGFSDASSLDVGHWHLRAQFVASEKVFELLTAWMDAKPGRKERVAITDSLKRAMRDDLRSL